MISMANVPQRPRKDSCASVSSAAGSVRAVAGAKHDDTTFQNRVEVIDPLMKTGFMFVPMTSTFPTRGLEDWLRNKGEMKKDLSICCLFQKGRCNLGAKCHQIHADRTYVAEQRTAAVDAVTCCAHCGDEVSRSDSVRRALSRAFPSGSVLLSSDDGTERIPVERLAWTQRLKMIVEAHNGGSAPMLQASRVCRLHQQGRCKYGSHCKNFHVCFQSDVLGQNKEETSTQAASEGRTISRDATPRSTARRGSVTPPPLDLPLESTPSTRASLRSPLSEEKVLEWAVDLVFSPSRLNTQACSFDFQVHHPLFTPPKMTPLC